MTPARIDEARLVELFLDLLRIDAPPLRERESVAWTRRYLEGIGLEVWEDDAGARLGGNANNLFARLPANREGMPRIFLSAHFDTVEPTRDLRIVEQDGVFSSDGTTILGADDKGGMAPAIEAIHALMESDEPHGEVLLLLTVAEEIGLRGAWALDLKSLDLDFGYVLDTGPPVGTFVSRTATHDHLDITVVGRPAHAGKEPEKGVNALQVAAEAIHGMSLGRIGPETTANLGIVEGGTAVNVVLSKVHIRAEARSTSLVELEAQVGHMAERFERAGAAWGASVDIVHERQYEGFELSPDSPVLSVARAASEATGLAQGLTQPLFRTTLGGSDANVFNKRGVPTAVVATGMDRIHTHEERISRRDLVDTTKLALELVRQAARAGG